MYRADFSGEYIQQIEEFIDIVATENKLRVFRKDRKNMAVLTEGNDAFYSVFYYNDDPVISITNVGAGTVLSIIATDYGNLPIEQLNSIVKRLTTFLTEEGMVKNLHLHTEQQKI